MLYDPKWEQQTKADPFSLASLITWLETMPEHGGYYSGNPRGCLLGQWLQSIGLSAPDAARKSLNIGILEPYQTVAIERPHTFGAALARAKALRGY